MVTASDRQCQALGPSEGWMDSPQGDAPLHAKTWNQSSWGKEAAFMV